LGEGPPEGLALGGVLAGGQGGRLGGRGRLHPPRDAPRGERLPPGPPGAPLPPPRGPLPDLPRPRDELRRVPGALAPHLPLERCPMSSRSRLPSKPAGTRSTMTPLMPSPRRSRSV